MFVFSSIVFIDFVSSFVYECFGSCIEHQMGSDIILGLLFPWAIFRSRCCGLNGHLSMSMCCYIYSATVKVMALLYAALLVERHCEQLCCCHEGLYQALLWVGSSHVVLSSSEFLKMSKQSPLESFHTELFINEVERLMTIWYTRSSSYG